MDCYLERGNRGYARFAQERLAIDILAAAKDTIGASCPFDTLPAAGATVDLEFPGSALTACYHMQVVVAPTAPEDGMILQRAASATYAQRRRTWRVPLENRIAFRRLGESSASEAIVMNLSCEGMLMSTSLALAVSSVIEIMLALPGQPAHVVQGRVVRIDPSEPACFGVLFLDLGPEPKRSLTYFMWDRLRTLYPREIKALWPGSRRKVRWPANQPEEPAKE